VDRTTHQHASAGVNLASVRCARNWLLTPTLAWDFISPTEPGYWEQLFTYLDYQRLPEADFVVGQTRYGTFGHDWRQVPINAWLDLMVDRELDREFGMAEVADRPAALLALSPGARRGGEADPPRPP
jgi:hypothetical protein